VTDALPPPVLPLHTCPDIARVDRILHDLAEQGPPLSETQVHSIAAACRILARIREANARLRRAAEDMAELRADVTAIRMALLRRGGTP